jgi:hypothetical protein
MMVTVTVYERDSGAILHELTGSIVDLVKDVGQGQDLIDGAWNGETYYVVSGTITPRPQLPALPSTGIPADGETAYAISGLPAQTFVSIGMLLDEFGLPVPKADPHKYPFSGLVDDGALEWTSTIPGTYAVSVQPPFPYQRLDGQVVVQ